MAAGFVDLYRRLWGWWSGTPADDERVCYALEVVPYVATTLDVAPYVDSVAESAPYVESTVEVDCR